MDIKTILAEAYLRSQVAGDHAGAITALRAALTDSTVQAAAHAERMRLDAFMRSVRGRRGCHVSRVMHSLLAEALST